MAKKTANKPKNREEEDSLDLLVISPAPSMVDYGHIMRPKSVKEDIKPKSRRQATMMAKDKSN